MGFYISTLQLAILVAAIVYRRQRHLADSMSTIIFAKAGTNLIKVGTI